MPASDTWLAALTRRSRWIRGSLAPSPVNCRGPDAERAHAPLSRAVVCDVFRARTNGRRDQRRVRGAVAARAARPLHVRQRLLVHQAIGLGAASVSRDADRRRRRVGARGAVVRPPDRVRAGRGRRPLARTIRFATNSSGPASCIGGCTSCSASGRFRRPPTSRVRSARASSRTRAASASVRAMALAFAWPLGQYMGARSAVRAPEWAPVEGRLMRILVVVHGFPPTAQGGSEIYAHAHARALAALGDDVLVLTREQDPQRPEYAVREDRRDGLRVVRVNNTFRNTRTFEETYANGTIDAIASRRHRRLQTGRRAHPSPDVSLDGHRPPARGTSNSSDPHASRLLADVPSRPAARRRLSACAMDPTTRRRARSCLGPAGGAGSLQFLGARAVRASRKAPARGAGEAGTPGGRRPGCCRLARRARPSIASASGPRTCARSVTRSPTSSRRPGACAIGSWRSASRPIE